MSLRRITTLYCIAVIAIGVLLATLGGFVGWLAAMLVMGGALPLYRLISWQNAQAGREGVLIDLANDLIPDHRDNPLSAPEAQDSR